MDRQSPTPRQYILRPLLVPSVRYYILPKSRFLITAEGSSSYPNLIPPNPIFARTSIPSTCASGIIQHHSKFTVFLAGQHSWIAAVENRNRSSLRGMVFCRCNRRLIEPPQPNNQCKQRNQRLIIFSSCPS